MPNQTFFNLSEEKQKRLLKAAKEEFSRVPLYEASINNIVKKADISRGSFYQYFKDKEDLYYYFLGNVIHDSKALIVKCLEEAEGDLIKGYELFCPTLLKQIMKKSNIEFFRHLFLHMDYRTSKEVTPESLQQHKNKDWHNQHELEKHINKELFNLSHEEDYAELTKFIMSFLMQCIGEGFAKDYTQEEIANKFNQKLEWVANGVKVYDPIGGKQE